MTPSSGPKPLDEGAPPYIQFWLPAALLGLVLVILLVALLKRRRRARRTSADLKLRDQTISVAVYSPCSDSGPLEADPPNKVTIGDAASVPNPSYERNISGTELERSGDFFCPPLNDTPNQLRAKGRVHSEGRPGEVRGNPPALLGNFNVGFSEGNYSPVSPGQASSEPSPVADARYDIPGGLLGQLAPLTQPWKSPKSPPGHGYEEPPCEGQRSPPDGAHTPVTYEVTLKSPRGSRSTSSNPDTSYEVASIKPAGLGQTFPKYAKVDKGCGEKSPGADSGYEVASLSPGYSPVSSGYEAASISPGHSPASAGAPLRYDYVYASPAGHPPKNLASVNQYNVLQSSCKEADGEYSMLNRNKGDGLQTSPTVPIIVSVNEYNTIDIASKK